MGSSTIQSFSLGWSGFRGAKLLPLMLEGSKDAPLLVERVYYTKGDGNV